MRSIIFIIVAVLLGAAAYTAYGVLTFEPDRPRPLVFKEPDAAALADLGVTDATPPAEEAAPAVPGLSDEQQQQTEQAVSQIDEAMNVYKQMEMNATPQVKSTIQTLTSTMATGQLPAYFLTATAPGMPARSFERLDIDLAMALAVTPPADNVSCIPGDSRPTSVLIGDNGANTLTCDVQDKSGDQIFVSGPGNDTISDSWGNRIVNAGSGDDTILLGPGRSIIILEDGWGHDQVTIDCAGALISPNEIPSGFAVPWTAQYTNFIVLSPRIQPSAIKWNGNVLTNTASGDTLAVSQNCFNVIGMQ